MAEAVQFRAAVAPVVTTRRRWMWWLAAAAVIVAAAGVRLWQERAQRPKYLTAAVSRGSIQRSVTATGAINPVVTVQVGSYVSGTIKSLSCDYNTEVVIGQECARIDPVPFQLIVDQDKAQVATAEAQLKKDRAALAYAKVAYERDSKLLAEHTVSQDTVDSDRNVYTQAQEQIGLDEASINEKIAQLKAAQVNLAYTKIVSPVVGTVITRAIDVGQTVAASLASPTLFLIGRDLTHMQVDTNVSEADVGEVHEGQDVLFTVQTFPGKNFQGKVSQIRRGPITVQNVVTYDVVVAVDNPDRKLFPGMTADAHIISVEHKDVLRVPLPATRFVPDGVGRGRKSRRGGEDDKAGAGDDDKSGEGDKAVASETRGEGKKHREGREKRTRVWVLDDDGTIRPVPVRIGIDDGQLIEVSGEGLKAGDKVVVNEADKGDGKPGQNQNRGGQGMGMGMGGGRGPRL